MQPNHCHLSVLHTVYVKYSDKTVFTYVEISTSGTFFLPLGNSCPSSRFCCRANLISFVVLFSVVIRASRVGLARIHHNILRNCMKLSHDLNVIRTWKNCVRSGNDKGHVISNNCSLNRYNLITVARSCLQPLGMTQSVFFLLVFFSFQKT